MITGKIYHKVFLNCLKPNIKDKNYEYTIAKGHLWLEMEISLEPEPNEES